MINSYDLATRGIYPYNVSGMPYVSWNAFTQDSEHAHATDIIVEDSCYTVRIALAGYHKSDIKVKIVQGKLVITAIGTHDVPRDLKVITREIPFGEFSRVYELNNIDVEGIVSSFNNGILTLTLPKSATDGADDERDISFQ